MTPSLESVLRASEEEFGQRFPATDAFHKSNDGRITVIADNTSLKAFLRQAQLKVVDAVRSEAEAVRNEYKLLAYTSSGDNTDYSKQAILAVAALSDLLTRLDEAKKTV